MKNYSMQLPSKVYGGKGSIDQLKEILEKEQVKKAMIFTYGSILASGLGDLVFTRLQEAGVAYEVFDELVPEPTVKDVEKMMAAVENSQGQIMIAIGGGSVMDVAKLYTILKNADYTIRDLLKNPSIGKKTIKSIMIPTTCGTGSEATCNSIVTVPEENLKVGIVNDDLIPDYVILDPITIQGLPKDILASTGVDALAHAVECFTSKKANPFSDTYALAAAKLILTSIKAAYDNPDDMEAKTNMLLGSFYGGVAITSSGTTAVHALAYPLGGKYRIPHGVSNAILLAQVMAFNQDACQDKLAMICDAVNPAMAPESPEKRAGYVIKLIAEIVDHTQIPTSLEEFGVKAEDIDFLVEAASKVTRLLDNNVKALSLQDIREIYQKVM